MRIVSMTATFGKLDGQTLDFRQGLNVVSAPNEWGKSTWCEFLTAMLYGVDTRARGAQGRLPEKEKYTPWSGKPMEGSIRLIHGDRDITIQRWTQGRIPLGAFRAYETRTGLPVPDLTAENCGMELLGVERSVFRRTGFLRLSDLSAPAEESLRTRLAALAATGDDSGDAELLGKKLKELKNRCRYNKNGLIPECSRQIRTLETKLREHEALASQTRRLEEQIQIWEQRMAQLERHRAVLAWQESREDQNRIAQAEQAEKTARRLARELEAKCEDYPAREVLEEKICRAEELLEEIGPGTAKVGSPAAGVLCWILAAAAALGGSWLLTQERWPAAIAVLAVVLVCGILGGVLFDRWRHSALERRIEESRLGRRREELETALAKWQRQLDEIDDLEQALLDEKKAAAHLQTLRATARTAAEPETDDGLELDREQTEAELRLLGRDLSRGRTLLAQCDGRREAMEDPKTLAAALDGAKQRLKELEQTEQALEYALQARQSALRELQRRFAPGITRKAGEFLSFLTEGEYDRISVDEGLNVHAAKQQETTLRPALRRSDGTGDLMYLALKLAVWETIAPEAPLVLDDALVRFDDTRLEKAMELLARLGDTRQILLFSCQEREKAWMDR